MNLKKARLVLNAKCRVHVDYFRSLDHPCDKQNIVKVVDFIYVLTSNEKISKIEKTYF